MPIIIRNGAEWYASIGTETSKGTKVFALTGEVADSGLIEVPMGVTLREIVYEIGGGIEQGKPFKAVQMGGPSGGCLPESKLDTPVDYQSLVDAGVIMGSGGMVVMDDQNCMVDVAHFFLNFCRDESCGQCTPCREGTAWTARLLRKIERGEGTAQDIEILKSLRTTMSGTTICLLSDFSITYLQSVLKHFAHEFEAHIQGRACLAERPREVRSA
ncbi:MAG: SLBB domain-containing protein [Limnochordales bacterium]